MKYILPKNSTGIILPVYIQDISSSIAGGLTGVIPSTSGLKAYYKKSSDATPTLFNIAVGTVGTYVASGLVAVSNTNAPGDYELCLPNAAFTASVGSPVFLTATLYGGVNMLPVKVDIQLVDNNAGYALTEPSAVPTFPATDDQMAAFLFQRATNLKADTATQSKIYKSDGTTVLATSTLSDDSTTLTRTRYL